MASHYQEGIHPLLTNIFILLISYSQMAQMALVGIYLYYLPCLSQKKWYIFGDQRTDADKNADSLICLNRFDLGTYSLVKAIVYEYENNNNNKNNNHQFNV